MTEDQETKIYAVTFRQEMTEYATIYVRAEDEESANEVANELIMCVDVDWYQKYHDYEMTDCEEVNSNDVREDDEIYSDDDI